MLGATTVLLAVASTMLSVPATAVPTPIDVSPLSVDFGAVDVGSTPPPIAVQVTNTGGSPFGPINIFGGAPPTPEFNASQNCQGATLAAGASCQVSYTFSPSAPGPASDSSPFTISQTANQADGEAFTVALSGCGNPCPPTITSFTPMNGSSGTPVTIIGTRFTGATAVTFGGVAATGFTVQSPTVITAVVPASAATGRIAVTTPGGTGTSTTDFVVGATQHDRSIAMNLRKHLIARGRVISDLDACESGVTVRMQRRRPDGSWKNVGNGTTNTSGDYRIELKDKEGRYRATVEETVIGSDVCLAATSNRDRHAD